jgi:hypothetical protein
MPTGIGCFTLRVPDVGQGVPFNRREPAPGF